MLKPGIYEQVVTKAIQKELSKLNPRSTFTENIDEAEAASVLTQYVSDVIQSGIKQVKDYGGNVHSQVELANEIIQVVQQKIQDMELEASSVDDSATQLLAIKPEINADQYGEAQEIPRPQTSLVQSSLFTGAEYEPQMYAELKKEILSADRIDMLVSFIKWSGLSLLLNELEEFTARGGILRVITTSYMGATDIKAVEELSKLQHTQVKISYDTKSTRLHAKTYVFYRDTGFTTAYIGSSNLSNAALTSGLEWNLKVTLKDQPETIHKIAATFDSYWFSKDFESYGVEKRYRLQQALQAEKHIGEGLQTFIFDITPRSYQQEILDKLDAERQIRGHYRNLVVAATGTGKTLVSAFDYKRFCRQQHGKMPRLLFVAHREEILKQSLTTFRGVLKDANFGDLYVGNYKPEKMEHLFVSIQTCNSQALYEQYSSDYYDYIVVDEFHHAAAPTYDKLLKHFKPHILLGLTATPERMDGKSVLHYFDNRIAAEIRLQEAIDSKMLCPFHYFGVSDTTDLSNLKWVRGGYDKKALSTLYTENLVAQQRAALVIQALEHYSTDMDLVKALGFCVSVDHAKFMTESFENAGIPSACITGNSPDSERTTVQQRLVSGELRCIFTVDVYNEGVDIPEVNTVLFLRPTESLTIFLQQLGRGLRLTENKDCLTVLDFIGQANKKYNFEEKFTALITPPKKDVQKAIKQGFPFVPKGCYIQLEKKARDYILENIKRSLSGKSGIIQRIASFQEDSGLSLSLSHFLDFYHMDIGNIYKGGKTSFARLCVMADVTDDFLEPLEETLSRAFTRICAIDSRNWIRFLQEILQTTSLPEYENLDQYHRRMLQMFQFTVWQQSAEDCGFTSPIEGIKKIQACPKLCAELLELLAYKFNKIDFVDQKIDLGFDCPLDLHCTYSRDQILVAMDFMKPGTVREGVKWLQDKKLDIFFITLNKSDKDYSPTTMYEDYSINDHLFHWQSQSTTSAQSNTGTRYINHKQLGSKVLLFVREFKQDALGAAPYTFLGLANYMSHEGSKPMSITWRLAQSIPAKYLKKTNKLMVM